MPAGHAAQQCAGRGLAAARCGQPWRQQHEGRGGPHGLPMQSARGSVRVQLDTVTKQRGRPARVERAHVGGSQAGHPVDHASLEQCRVSRHIGSQCAMGHDPAGQRRPPKYQLCRCAGLLGRARWQAMPAAGQKAGKQETVATEHPPLFQRTYPASTSTPPPCQASNPTT